jgi:hypothetical protein
MALPNFYIPGAQKSGTTWLASMLRQHPEIYIPRKKEIHYFNLAENYHRGQEWYENHFTNCGNASAIGEATPDYLPINATVENAKVIERIQALTPGARFIICLRNPVTRAVSALLHQIRERRVSPWTDLDAEMELILSGRPTRYHVLEYGLYSMQIRSFLRHFPINQFAFIIYEHDICANKHQTLRSLCQFLGVRANFEFHHVDALINPAMRTRMGMILCHLFPRRIGRNLGWRVERLGWGQELSIAHDTWQRLYQYYASDMVELSTVIGRDLEIWRHQKRTD